MKVTIEYSHGNSNPVLASIKLPNGKWAVGGGETAADAKLDAIHRALQILDHQQIKLPEPEEIEL